MIDYFKRIKLFLTMNQFNPSAKSLLFETDAIIHQLEQINNVQFSQNEQNLFQSMLLTVQSKLSGNTAGQVIWQMIPEKMPFQR